MLRLQALYEGVRSLLYGKWGTTFQVINFMVYPSLARVCMGLQKCVELDDGKRKPFIDLDESCGSGDYKMYSGLTGFLAASYLLGYPIVRGRCCVRLWAGGPSAAHPSHLRLRLMMHSSWCICCTKTSRTSMRSSSTGDSCGW